jgi:hypothetical protein
MADPVSPLEAARRDPDLALRQILHELGVRLPAVFRWLRGQRHPNPRSYFLPGIAPVQREQAEWVRARRPWGVGRGPRAGRRSVIDG